MKKKKRVKNHTAPLITQKKKKRKTKFNEQKKKRIIAVQFGREWLRNG